MAVATPSKVATITGTFLTPGVSSNGRLYTREAIGRAVQRMQSAIADGSAPPITQLTSHGTDDVLQTVGRLTKVWQDPNTGNGKYESEAPPTAAGRDLATLAKFGYAQAVSISGRWVGDVRTEEHEGEEVETADDIDVARIDYVPRGGVTGARIDSVAMAEGAPVGDFRDEFPSAVKVFTEDLQGVTYADTGYRADKKKRYAIDTKEQALAAWSYINQKQIAEQYSIASLAAVRSRIHAALKKFGVTPKESGEQPTQELDPDGDGDVDAVICPQCGAAIPVTDPKLNPDAAKDAVGSDGTENDKGNEMTEEAKEIKTEGISDADVAKIGAALVPSLAAALKEALKPAEVIETPAPAPVAETVDEQVKRLVEAQKAEIVAAVVKEYGLPSRTGFVANSGSTKPLHEMSGSELRKASAEVADALLGQNRLGVIYPGVNRNND